VKTIRLLYLVRLVFVFNLINVNAQIDYEKIRNTDTISYYVNNPYGNLAELTWTIDGGTIVGHSTLYTAEGADTIKVIWDDSNKNTANFGSLKVSESLSWPGGSSCQSEEEQIHVESWVQPKATTNISSIRVCQGESFVVKINFEGEPGYQYKWKLYEKEYPEILVENHTTDFINSINTSADIVIAGLKNSSSSQKLYKFEITDVQDGLNDGMTGNVLMSWATIYVQSKPLKGTLKTTNHLIRR